MFFVGIVEKINKHSDGHCSHVMHDFYVSCRSFIAFRLSGNDTVTSEYSVRNKKYNFLAIKNGKY